MHTFLTLLIFVAIATMLARVSVAYDESCGMYAQFLWSPAEEYESAKASYESACSPYYGYSRDDESACGSYVYERRPYEGARDELESAIQNVGIFCGASDAMLQALRAAYEQKIHDLEAKLKETKQRQKKMEKKLRGAQPGAVLQ